MPLHLVSVDEHSPAQRLGLEPGCTLLAIDGNPLNDALDYQFYTSAPHFTLTICQNGAQQQISVEKGELSVILGPSGGFVWQLYHDDQPDGP